MRKYFGVTLFSLTLFFNIFSLKAFFDLTDAMKDKVHHYPELVHLNGFEMCYLTLWTFIFQLIFMIVAVLDETLRLMNMFTDMQKILNKTRAVMYNTVLFPSSLIVVTTFWTIWYIERDLVFPRILDSFFPMWLNHMLHTFIIVPVIIELLLPKKNNFINFKKAAPALVALFVIYFSVYFSVYFRHGIWLYPIYQVMTWPQRLLFTLFQLFLGLGFQLLGIVLQNAKKSLNKQKLK